jgi:hypothetical protein
MSNKWRAIALPLVDLDTLRAASHELGTDLRACGHVAATEPTAKLFRESGIPAISIVELIDLIVWDSMPNQRRVPISSFPHLNIKADKFRDELKDYNSRLSSWRRNLAMKRAALTIQIENVLRTYLRTAAADPVAGRMLRLSVKDFRRSILFMIQSNLRPSDFDVQDSLLRVACDAWSHLESQVPEVTNMRRDLWDHQSALSQPQSNAERNLLERVESTLSQVFGSVDGQRQLMFHGFYFFTPAQWALWQMFRQHSNINQCFIVHDDGSNRAFESWRHYFIERWSMPRVEYPSSPFTGASAAESLRCSLEGRRIADADLKHVEIVKFANTTEFVRHWSLQQAEALAAKEREPVLYAPQPADLNRVIDRIGLEQTSNSVNLANLPIGQFLLALHECVEFGTSGQPELILNGARLLDMAASGFLNITQAVKPSQHVAALRRALPFFDDVSLIADWATRAEALQRLVIGEVSALGPRVDGQSDVDRIVGAAANELRLAPWCDLTEVEVKSVVNSIRSAEVLLKEIVADGTRKADRYFEYARKSLERAMANLSEEERKQVLQKFDVVGQVGTQDLDAEGVKDVISFILGREVDFGSEDDDTRFEQSKVVNVRFVDALGLEKSPSDVHIANLGETMFPAKAQPYGWPFAEQSLKPQPKRFVTEEILRTRGQIAQLGDLYLFWLALGGLQPGRSLTLSWISRVGNELQNPSSLLALITRLDGANRSVAALTGGARLTPPNRGVPANQPRKPRAPRPVSEPVARQNAAAALPLLDRAAASSAIVCSRRFVLQWALGPTASFSPTHMQSMLYGNVIGVMARRGRLQRSNDAIRQLAADLWRQFTPGERHSSLVKRRVMPSGPTARWQWIFTLGGSKTGTEPTDRAYQAASDVTVGIPVAALVGPEVGAIIPPRPLDVTAQICDMCPVAPRCSERVPRD